MGATAILTTLTDTKIASNLKRSTQAFYQAEAGVHFALSSIPGLIVDGSLSLDGINATETLAIPITAPAGFSFDPIATFTRVGSSKNYEFQVTGRTANASHTIKAVFRRKSPLPYGFFGDELLDLRASSRIYSSDSTNMSGQEPSTSTGEGNTGSNVMDSVVSSVTVDGQVIRGEKDGNPGAYDTTQTPTVVGGWPPDLVGPIDPDPLGASGGSAAADIAAASSTNDNNDPFKAIPTIINNIINLDGKKNKSMTLKGPGTFYLESITLNAGSNLSIDTRSGPINIYLKGSFLAQRNSFIDFPSTTSLTDLSIISDSIEPVTLKHSGTFKGVIYAPYASVEIDNSWQVGGILAPFAFGLVWSKTAILGEFGQFYFDTALKNKFFSQQVTIVGWQDSWN